MTRTLACILWTVALLMVGRPAMALRDNGLSLLSNIRMPHTFTAPEMRIMKGQLDTLRLGIDLTLAMLGNMTDADKQATFTSMWPGIKCIFNSDLTGNGKSPYGPAAWQPQSGMSPPNRPNQQQQPALDAGNQQPANQAQDQAGQQPVPEQSPSANPQQPDQQPDQQPAEPSPPTDQQQPAQ